MRGVTDESRFLFLAAVDPLHNGLEDIPGDVQNRQAEQKVLQHARILLSVLVVPPFTGSTDQGPVEVAAHLCRELQRPDQNNQDGPYTKGDQQNVEEETIIKKRGALLVVHIVTNR